MAYGDTALTGSHRLPAAEVVGIEVPVIDIEELMAEHGTDWLALIDEHDGAWAPHWAALIWLADPRNGCLPADIIEHYGLDAG